MSRDINVKHTTTLASICGPKWPRLLSPTWAAAYCGMYLSQFRQLPETSALIFEFGDKEKVDRDDLDQLIAKKKEEGSF